MYNFSAGLVIAARAGAKTGLPVCHAQLEQQKLSIAIGHFFRAGHKKVSIHLLQLSMGMDWLGIFCHNFYYLATFSA